jgi:hypothetical protein
MESYGTDSYLHLNRLGNMQEPLPSPDEPRRRPAGRPCLGGRLLEAQLAEACLIGLIRDLLFAPTEAPRSPFVEAWATA